MKELLGDIAGEALLVGAGFFILISVCGLW